MKVLRWGKPAEILANVPDFLPNLLVPTLIFHGSQDVAIPEIFARRVSVLIPDAQLIVLDSGHFVPLRQPEAVAASVAQFFGSRSGQPGTLAVAQA